MAKSWSLLMPNEGSKLAKIESQPLAEVRTHPLKRTLDDAIASGKPLAELQGLLDLYERMEEKMAKAA
jgi:hypothetical protein